MEHSENKLLIAIIAEIENISDELNQQVTLIQALLKNVEGSHIKEDFVALKNALKKSFLLLNRFYQLLGRQKDTSADCQAIRHDLRSVISAIIGFSELILDGISQHNTNRLVWENFSQIINLSQKLLHLIDQIDIQPKPKQSPGKGKNKTAKGSQDKQAAKQLKEAHQLLTATIESMEEGFAIFDLNDRLVSCNQQFYNFYPAVESLGGSGFTYEEFLRENIRLGTFQEERRKKIQQIQPIPHHQEEDQWVQRHLEYHQKTQQPYQLQLQSGKWIEVSENRVSSGGIVSIHKDITQEKENEQQLKFLAHHDSLTGLVNRNYFEKQMHEVLHQCEQSKNKCAILILDMDNFKELNETFGHDFGDYLLSSSARKFKAQMRAEDLVGRVGGDEFAAVIEGIVDLAQVEDIANRCLESIGMTIECDGRITLFSISLGIAIYPDHGTDIKELFKKADEAINAAKKEGTGTYRVAVIG